MTISHALVFVPGYGPVEVVVYVRDPACSRKAVTLAAYLYANEEATRSGRERTA